MEFNFSLQTTLIFPFWTTAGPLSMTFSCAIVFALGFAKEILVSGLALRLHNLDRYHSGDQTRYSLFSESYRNRALIRSIHHIIHLALHCFVMFFYMTYNAFIISSLLLGCGCGYYQAKVKEGREMVEQVQILYDQDI